VQLALPEGMQDQGEHSICLIGGGIGDTRRTAGELLRGSAARDLRAAAVASREHRSGAWRYRCTALFPFSVGLFAIADISLLLQGELYSQDGFLLEAWSIDSPRMPEGECWNWTGTASAGCPLYKFLCIVTQLFMRL